MPTEVVRLWRSMIADYVSDLTMLLEPLETESGANVLRVTVCSQRFDDAHPDGYVYVWAFRDFPSMGYSIRPNQLFDLLIVARESIVWVLVHGDDPPDQPIKGD
jgi:hypothetical protein